MCWISRLRSALLNRLRGVRTVGELQGISIDGRVVGEPQQWRGCDDRQKLQRGYAELAVAPPPRQEEKHNRSDRGGKEPSVVAGKFRCGHTQCASIERTTG